MSSGLPRLCIALNVQGNTGEAYMVEYASAVQSVVFAFDNGEWSDR